MQEVIVPTRDEYNDWRHNNISSQFFFKFITTFLEAYVDKMTSGDLLDGKSIDEIGLTTMKESTRAAIFRELYDMSYEDVYQIVTGEVYADISSGAESPSS